MKKIILICIAAGIILLSACSNSKSGSSTPEAVKAAFTKLYPGISAKWEAEDGKYEANFTWEKQEMSALFEANGEMVELEAEIPVSELPAAVTTYINTHYNAAKIKEAAKITLTAGGIQYEATIKGKNLLFDFTGNFIKEFND